MKSTNSDSILNKYTSSISSFGELIFLIILLTIGLELIASVISNYFTVLTNIIIGFVLLFITMYYFFRRIGLLRRKLAVKFKGILFIDTESRLPIAIKNYQFSEKINLYFESAFSENKKIKTEWYKSKIVAPLDNIFNESEANNIIRESVEFYLLDLLHRELDTLALDHIFSNKTSKFDRENLK